MNSIFKYPLLLLLAVFSSLTIANDGTWRLEKDKNGIQVYTRAVEGSDFRAIRAVTHIDGSLSAIVASLQDMSFWPELNSIISLARVHEQQSETQSLVYMQMNMPWPVSDRDVLNRREIIQDKETLVVELSERATMDVMPVDEDYVRIVKSDQKWTLTPAQNGGTDLVWITHTDPNGPIPAAIVNMLSVGAPFDSLNTLRKTIEDGAYNEVELPFIANRHAEEQSQNTHLADSELADRDASSAP